MVHIFKPGLLLGLLGVLHVPLAAQPPAPPAWAFTYDPAYVRPPADDVPRRVPHSQQSYSSAQTRDLFAAPSWHPEEHPPMPGIVGRGRRPEARACANCHRAGGMGGPENAGLAGLPAAYIIQQMADIKSGARKLSVPQKALNMWATARAVTDEEVALAAAYFAELKPRRILTVVETDLVPRTYVAGLYYARHPDGGQEALGQRILEVPDDAEQFDLKDSRAQFTVYVPRGSVARGQALALSGAEGKTLACTTCHGADLRGAAAIPRIAGQSPSYLFRQLYDFKTGLRAGPMSAAMTPVVAQLSNDDMLALAAYLASRDP